MPKPGIYIQTVLGIGMLVLFVISLLFAYQIAMGKDATLEVFVQCGNIVLGILLWIAIGADLAVVIMTLWFRWLTNWMMVPLSLVALLLNIFVITPIVYGVPYDLADLIQRLLFSSVTLHLANLLQVLGADRNLAIILSAIFLSGFLVGTVISCRGFYERVSGKDELGV
jgi:hypothetical protein